MVWQLNWSTRLRYSNPKSYLNCWSSLCQEQAPTCSDKICIEGRKISNDLENLKPKKDTWSESRYCAGLQLTFPGGTLGAQISCWVYNPIVLCLDILIFFSWCDLLNDTGLCLQWFQWLQPYSQKHLNPNVHRILPQVVVHFYFYSIKYF